MATTAPGANATSDPYVIRRSIPVLVMTVAVILISLSLWTERVYRNPALPGGDADAVVVATDPVRLIPDPVPCNCTAAEPESAPVDHCPPVAPVLPPAGVQGAEPPRRLAFVDCGANRGNSYEHFVHPGNRNLPWQFPDNDTQPSEFEAYLIEVHPTFDRVLTKLSVDNPRIHAYTQTACHSSDGNLTIFLDLYSGMRWGSGPFQDNNVDYAMSENKTNVTVAAVPIGTWIKRQFQPRDYVILKLDIEGSEYAVIEHLLQVGAFTHIDQFLVEWHPQYEAMQTGGRTRLALTTGLEQAGVRNYDHHSSMR